MRTVAIVSRKGGVGKSTLAMNLAVVATNAQIIDTDPQANCADWEDRRVEEFPGVVTAPASRIKASLKRCNGDWTFIDTQASAEASLIEIAQAADICIVVVRPGQLELDALGATLAAIQAAKAKAVFCLNQVHPQAKLDDVVESLSEFHPVGPLIRMRADFSAAVTEGMAAIDWKPTGKAALEIIDYWHWLKEQFG